MNKNGNVNNRSISCLCVRHNTSFSMALTRFLLGFAFLFTFSGFFGYGVSYVRPAARKTISIPSLDHDSASPQQVHISMVGQDKMRISWITDAETSATVDYGTTKGSNQLSATGTSSSYKYILYTSGQIHNIVIGPLEPDTVYFYRFPSGPSQEFSFKTPPVKFPIKFAVVGDLGQTDWTNSTLQHIAASNYDVMLLPGDLSYADFLQHLWDSFGRLVEPFASQRPWMVTQGNHEVEKIPVIHSKSFTSYNARWRMPFEESSSDSNLYYSFEVAGVHVIMLGSYTDFENDSAQYKWLQADLTKIDRNRTPWIIVLVHAPWYNSNTAHQGEYEADGMKQAMEELLYGARVDVVFAGHIHAYERFASVYNGKENSCAPVYITIGDGGNREGLATKYKDPKPDISIFREASFGHGQFQAVNASHALWEWHRNDDDVAVVADTVWFRSHASNPDCKV